MRLVLINPKFPESFWSFSWVLKNITQARKSLNSPLGLATLAGLTPADWEVKIIDENVEPIDWTISADIIGVCGMGVQVERQKEILRYFKGQGIFVVAGGSYASLCPEEYEGLANAVIAGESEYIWPQFCRDFIAGQAKTLYQEQGNVSLHDSPTPRFDLLKLHQYQRVSIQFSRGCPFQCEFCDIIVMFGRKPRNKTLDQVGVELDHLRQQGVTEVFFVDDNFIGNKKMAKDLLRFLVAYQERHHYRFSFGTEASVNLADDATLLALFRAANFEWVFMGIESPSDASLLETKKIQNSGGHLLDKIRTIYASGLDIMAGFIVGFDADDHSIFERQFRFIQDSGIVIAMVALLTALPKTPLYQRLAEAKRLRSLEQGDNTRVFTNIVPAQMTSQELVDGFIGLHRRLGRDASIYQRIAHKVTYLTQPVAPTALGARTQLAYLGRFFFKGVLPGGPVRWYYFLRSLWLGCRHPQTWSLIITNWIAAVSLKSFASRHLEKPVGLGEWTVRHFQQNLVQQMYKKVRREILFKISQWHGIERIWIDLKDHIGRQEAGLLAPAIKKYLQRCQGSIILDLRDMKEPGLTHLKHLLGRLENYSQQIHLYLSEEIYHLFSKELAGFQFTLIPSSAHL